MADHLRNEQNEVPERLSADNESPDAGERFTDFARKLFAVPKEEYDREAEAVRSGKPLKHDLSKHPRRPKK